MQEIKIHISSCSSHESFYGKELKKTAALSQVYLTKFTEDPDEADIIIIVDIDNTNLFENLRNNSVWRKYPNKAFGLYEGDCAPTFLHGLYSDARASRLNFNRFLGLDYHMHQLCFPNPVPDYQVVHNHHKDLLFSFAGRMSHKLRKKMLKFSYPEHTVKLVDTSNYNHFDPEGLNRTDFQESYWSLALRSKYVLCPKGAAASSVRIFEMMEAGIAPVIISDNWVPPYGPTWRDFAIIVPEKYLANLYCIVKAHEDEWAERGQKARVAWEEYFSPEKYWDFCLESINQLISQKIMEERIFEKFYLSILIIQKLKLMLFKVLLKSKALYNKYIVFTK